MSITIGKNTELILRGGLWLPVLFIFDLLAGLFQAPNHYRSWVVLGVATAFTFIVVAYVIKRGVSIHILTTSPRITPARRFILILSIVGWFTVMVTLLELLPRTRNLFSVIALITISTFILMLNQLEKKWQQ
jgi:uncharacterized membrane protein YhfC